MQKNRRRGGKIRVVPYEICFTAHFAKDLSVPFTRNPNVKIAHWKLNIIVYTRILRFSQSVNFRLTNFNAIQKIVRFWISYISDMVRWLKKNFYITYLLNVILIKPLPNA